MTHLPTRRAPWTIPGWTALGALSLALAGPARAGGPAPAPAPQIGQTGQSGQTGQEDELELAELLAGERREADRLRRRGDFTGARRILAEHLADDPEDVRSRVVFALLRFDEAAYAAAVEEAERALAGALATDDRALQASAARAGALALVELGRARAALELLERTADALSPTADARDAWLLASAHLGLGGRDEAERLLRLGADSGADQDWQGLLARARCERALGLLERAQKSLVFADRAAREGEGSEPDVLAEMASLYFEADREVEAGASRSAKRLYDEALSADPVHEQALLGLFELHRTNWRRSSRSAEDILVEALAARPDSIPALVAGAAADLDDGLLPRARERLARLEQLAPERRDVRTLRAALAWVEHDREGCEAILGALVANDARDARPEREVGRHLLELYRFGEGRAFLERAVERDPRDHVAWTHLGRARANVGDEEGGLAALKRAQAEAGLRQDAWRDNTALVLERIERGTRVDTFGELSFAWQPDAADVLALYLVPFYQSAREELAQRYGFTPGPVRIEVFDRHQDFSVRSTGFEGFPALGVCFGPVVTALSPLSELRGTFSWARTSFHEFTHVIHLGLSHNRCPRWITEGLATWEEAQKDPAWDRNMRRELLDALANEDVIPVRELNRAFRGPRIIFGYYEGGLVCEQLIERYGFASTVRLLEAFDRGLDLDQALEEVFDLTPEELDRDLERLIRERVGSLAIEPRWDPARLPRVKLSIPRELPTDAAGIERWNDAWCTLAWGAWQAGRRVDAEEALRQVRRSGVAAPRALFLLGEMALAAKESEAAIESWTAGIEAGGEDFRARIALGSLVWQSGDLEGAEKHFLAAERAFPGFAEPELAAERKLAALYFEQDREEEALAALERYFAYDASDLPGRVRVARAYVERGDCAPACELFREANEVDPFARGLHVEWGDALFACARYEEAAREFGAALLVPPELDLNNAPALLPVERAELLAKQALCFAKLGRLEEARAKAAEALALDEKSEKAKEALALCDA